MEEIRANEQYFFADQSVHELGQRLSGFETICCLCAPTLARYLAECGRSVMNLDIDRRFESVPGFRYYDILKPEWLDQKPSVIFCDPPFFNVSFRQLVHAIRMLAHNDPNLPIMVTYLDRRAEKLLQAFAEFNLQAMDYLLTYETVEDCDKNRIRLFQNFTDHDPS